MEEKKILEEELLKNSSRVTEMEKEFINKRDLEEEFTCSICQSLMMLATTLPCSHAFCSKCLEEWLDVNNVSFLILNKLN